MSDFIVKPLDASTWPDFARLVEKSNGIWSGSNDDKTINIDESPCTKVKKVL